MAALILKPGREKSLLRRHPWVFSGAVGELRGEPPNVTIGGQPGPGQTVALCAASGAFLAVAAYSPVSQIAARVWTWDEGEAVDAGFFERRLRTALALPYRQESLRNPRGAARLVHAESDGLPGLIVDRYADFLVLQSLTTGTEAWKPTILLTLNRLLAPTGILERSDVAVRHKEGLPPVTGLLSGRLPPPELEIEENGLLFGVDLAGGHKTGAYLDQRENRRLFGGFAGGREVLDAFSYTGGFALSALRGGASSVTALDSAAGALAGLARNAARNGLPAERLQAVEGDAFRVLRHLRRDAGRRFDLIALDPPKLAHNAAQVQRAARAYKDINLLAFKLLRPGGLLFTFSCSGAVSADLFQKIVAGAALDAGVQAQITHRLTQAPDHPVALNFPEGEYLKGLVCRVSEGATP